MGLGKTVQTLSAAQGRTLVVAPAVLLDQWQTEAQKWAPNLDLTTVSYHSLVGREKTDRGGTRMTNRLADPYATRWDTVIFDEAHHLKNRTTTWVEAVLYANRRDWTSNLWLLSGTPIPNWAHELYVPLRLLHPHNDPRYTSYWRWVRHWFSTWKPPYAVGATEIGKLKKDWSWEQFREGNDLNELVLRRLRDDVLDELPPVTQTVLWLDMTPTQRRAYNSMRKEFFAYLEDTGQVEIALTSGAQTTNLYKLTTGLPALDPTAKTSGSNKLSALDDILRDRGGESTVVFTWFRHSAQAAARVAKRHGPTAIIHGGVGETKRAEIVQRFQAGEISTLVGTLSVLREGLNLQRADVAVMLEHSHRPIDNAQAVRRIDRIGQTRPVTIIHLATKDSLDEHLRRRLRDKRSQSRGVIKVSREMV